MDKKPTSQTRTASNKKADVPGKTAPKAARAKTTPVKKAPVKKVSAKKTPVKKVSAKAVSAKKAPANKTDAKKVAAKVKSSNTTAKRETLVSLRAHVDRVEARLKRADSLTRSSIKAIETSFEALTEQSRKQAPNAQNLDKSTAAAKDAIGQHVRMLTGQLTRMVEKTRASVTSELSGAIETPDINHLQSVLNIVDEQMAETDIKLSRAISSINRNIADIALAVDSQIKTQAVTQKKAVDNLRSETEKARYALIQKLDRIEQDSAHAIRTIGDKVTSATNKIKEASDIKADVLRNDVTKLVETSQLEVKTEIKADIEALKREIQSRMETLESDHVQATSQRERGYKSLETRIESLEFGLNSVTETVSNAETASIAAAFDAPSTSTADKSASAVTGSAFGMDMSSDNPKIGEVDYLDPAKITPLPLQVAGNMTGGSLSPKRLGLNGNNAQAHSLETSSLDAELDHTPSLSDNEVDLQTFLARYETPEDHGLSSDTQIQTESASDENPYAAASQQADAALQNPYSTDFQEIQAIAQGEFAAQPLPVASTPEYHPQNLPNNGQLAEQLIQPTEYNPAPAVPTTYDQGANISDIQPYLDGSAYQNPQGISPANAFNNNALSSASGTSPVEYSSASVESYNDLPYENPAYADPAYNTPDDSMATARPGAYARNRKSNKAKSPSIRFPHFSKQNKRTLGLALGVTAISLVGINVLTNKTATPDDKKTVTAANTGSNPLVTVTQNPSISTVETIGDYADNKGTALDANTAGFNDLESAAKGGDAIAQFQLGLSYLQNGRTDDAVKLIRVSADSGLAAAQYRLAKLYEVGEGVAEDAVMARTLTERAARSGNRIAMHDLALYYAEGRGGVNLDMVTAAKWFEKAAERGVVDSQFNLGVLFESGQGLPQNLTDAYVWYSVAAKQGDQLAAQQLAVLSTQLDSSLIKSADIRVKNFKPTRIDKQANGIFENVPWAVKVDKTAEINRIKVAQDLLSELGYDAGTPDGAMGPRTRTAIMSFEKTNNLPETGRVSAELIDRLSLAAGA